MNVMNAEAKHISHLEATESFNLYENKQTLQASEVNRCRRRSQDDLLDMSIRQGTL